MKKIHKKIGDEEESDNCADLTDWLVGVLGNKGLVLFEHFKLLEIIIKIWL